MRQNVKYLLLISLYKCENCFGGMKFLGQYYTTQRHKLINHTFFSSNNFIVIQLTVTWFYNIGDLIASSMSIGVSYFLIKVTCDKFL